MVYFVGAGSGAPDLITVRGARLLAGADRIIYAGSLVNPALLDYAKKECLCQNSAEMTLEQVLSLIHIYRPGNRANAHFIRIGRMRPKTCLLYTS